MKKTRIAIIPFLFSFYMMVGSCQAQTKVDNAWTPEKARQWFETKEWTNGLTLKAYESLNIQEFAKQYHKNKAYWDKAFLYLKNTKLDTITPGKYYLDGQNVYISVTDGYTKDFEATKWEAHQKYIDIQYVIKGKEKMGMAPLSKATESVAFDNNKDVGFYTVADADAKFYLAEPGIFLIFFPKEAHRPSIKTDGCDSDKKIVIKIKAD